MAKFKLTKKERVPVLLGLAMAIILALISLVLVSSNGIRFYNARYQAASVGQLADDLFPPADDGFITSGDPTYDNGNPSQVDSGGNENSNSNSSSDTFTNDPTSQQNFGLHAGDVLNPSTGQFDDPNTRYTGDGTTDPACAGRGDTCYTPGTITSGDPSNPDTHQTLDGSPTDGNSNTTPGTYQQGAGGGGVGGGGATGGSGITGTGGTPTTAQNTSYQSVLGSGSGVSSGGSSQSTNCSGTNCQFQNPLGTQTNSLETFLNKLLDVVILIGSIAVVFSIITAGLKYVLARGDEKAISSAHTQLTWTVVGAAILLGAKVISLVIQNTVKALS